MNSASLQYRVAVAVLIVAAISVAGLANQSNLRPYVTGHFALTLDGSNNAGFIKSVEGGGEIEPQITMQLGVALNMQMLDWLNQSLKSPSRRNGSIAAADYNYKVRSYREFHSALISEVRIPPLDRSSKEPAYLTIRIRPESIQTRPGNGTPIPNTTPPSGGQRRWLPANFRFEIDGLDCRSITRLEFPNLVTKTPTPGGPVPIPYPNVTAQAANWQFRNGWPVKWVGPEFDAWQKNFRPRPGRLVLLDESGAPLLQIRFRMNRLIKGIPNQNERSMSFELFFDTFEMR